MKLLSQLTLSSRPWWLLAISALALEIVALYFQYGMGLEPCIMCIYQRVAIWGIFFAGVVGALGHQNIALRTIAFAMWGVGAIWGLITAVEHVEMQTSTSFFFSCDLVPNFPSWFAIHEWLPALFEASGDCGDIDWQFLGYSMPQWMIVLYSVYSALFAAVLMSRLMVAKKP